ncbi:hypothetical protein Tco_1493919 [Tanacetum coccineum]
MRCSNCQGIGHNKASCDKELEYIVPIPEDHRLEQGNLYLELMHQQEVMAGVLEVEEVLEVVEMVLEEVLELMDEDEIRENLEHDYMQDLLDTEEDKRIQQDREYQKKLDEEAFQEEMEQQHMQEQMDKERERQNKEEREWEGQNMIITI